MNAFGMDNGMVSWLPRSTAIHANSMQDFGSNMEFTNPMTSDNVLQDFDFDSFLHDGDADATGTFDFNTASFGMEAGGEIGAE